MTAHLPANTLYLNVEQVAERYGVSTASILRWRREGDFPAPVKVGKGCTRWRLDDLIEHESTFQACFMTDARFLLAS